MNKNYPIVLGITGASGILYGFRLLDFLLQNKFSVELILSDSALKVSACEMKMVLSNDPILLKEQILSFLDLSCISSKLNVWSNFDIAAPISSGSYKTNGMIILPASMTTVGSISSGLADNLITRSASVCLKERRKLVVVPREMPFSTIFLENLLRLSQSGAIIAPACPAFYHNPENISDSIDFVVGKILDLFDIEHMLFKRWRNDILVKESL